MDYKLETGSQGCYEADKNAIILTLDALLKTKEIVIERLAHAAQGEFTVTFDKNAAQQAGMRLINSH